MIQTRRTRFVTSECPWDSRFCQRKSIMKELMRMYQEQLQVMGFEGLGLRAVPHPKTELQGEIRGIRQVRHLPRGIE